MKKILFICLISIILLAGSSQSVTIKTKDFEIQKTDIIFVDKNNTIGPWDGSYQNPYQNITDAIKNAENNNIIYIINGIYNEQISIDKPIHLIGEDTQNTIIDAEYKKYGIKITSDNVKIEQITIRNSGGYEGNSGIIIDSNNNKITDSTIKRTKTGIFINGTKENTIKNCTLYLNGEGIYLKSCLDNIIENCEFCHSSIGINLRDSKNIMIKKSYIHESGTAIFSNISSDITLDECAISDNNDNGGGFAIYNSHDFYLKNCNIMHNGFGLRLIKSEDINLEKCDIQNMTHFGIWIQEGSENIKISDSDLINNFRHGIYMIEGKCEVVTSNIYNNQIESVYLEKSLCTAKNNYWGGKLGPLFNNGFRIVDLIKPKFRKIKYFPWSLNEYENIGSDWKTEDIFTKTKVYGYEDELIEFEVNDSDCDGLPDNWEEEFNYNSSKFNDHKNLDPDGDGLNNFEECYAYNWGADPFVKDIFLEIDYMPSKSGESNKIPQEQIEKMKQVFFDKGINLHIDQGELGCGGEIPYKTNFNFDNLTDLYWDHFLNNDLENPRKNIFHYGLICDIGPGNGFATIGWGHLNGFCISADVISKGISSLLHTRGELIAHGSLHELGHTLGLVVDDFGGNDNHAAMKPRYKEYYKYRNYKSVMNYRYTYQILDFSDGENGKIDYDDWAGMEFDFFKNTHFEWPKN